MVSSTEIDQRSKRVQAVMQRDEELIGRAAKRAEWAGAALRTAARDLSDAHGEDGNALTGLAELVLEQAARVSSLAEDIERSWYKPRPARRRAAPPADTTPRTTPPARGRRSSAPS